MRLWRAPLGAIVTAALLLTGTTVGVAGAQPISGPASGTVRNGTALTGGVPWNHVGPGWVLVQYASAPPAGGSGPAALYLISPDGTRYKLASWKNWRSAPQLVAWSPDGRRALFQVFSGQGSAELLTLATGRESSFVLPGEPTPIGFTTPHGLAIVAGQPADSGTSLARYTLSGALAQSLGFSTDGRVLYAPSGTEFLTGTSHGLKLVSNRGALIRQLPVPGTSASTCSAVRWWSSGTALAVIRRGVIVGSYTTRSTTIEQPCGAWRT